MDTAPSELAVNLEFMKDLPEVVLTEAREKLKKLLEKYIDIFSI